ncbi:MAG: hypothetical protein JW764_02015 [Chlorobiaceae bacterium]|nr:hypothetical protein [Chlorobiaceae bacterium]
MKRSIFFAGMLAAMFFAPPVTPEALALCGGSDAVTGAMTLQSGITWINFPQEKAAPPPPPEVPPPVIEPTEEMKMDTEKKIAVPRN